jgi:hypothetical protein
MSTNPRTTTRKVIGSLGVIGAAAGLGTFGTFTDSTTPVVTAVESGTVDIDLTPDGATVPATVTDVVPGGSMTRAVTLTSAGMTAVLPSPVPGTARPLSPDAAPATGPALPFTALPSKDRT